MTASQNGWTETTLGELGRYINGRGFKKSEWSDHGRPIIRIQNLTGSNSKFNRFNGNVEDRYIVRSGDLLMSWAATLGAYIWTGEEGVLNQHIFKVESRIDRRFHKYLLDHKLAELMRQTHGSGIVHITRGDFESLTTSIPDPPEQRRIVDILDDHLSRLDAAASAVAAAAQRTASLAAASAALHFQAAEVTSSLSTVGKHAQAVDYGSSTKTHATMARDDVPVLRMGNIKDGQIDWTSLKYLPRAHHEFPRLMLRPGDLLFNRTNSAEHVGKCAVFDSDVDASFASYLIRVRLDGTVLPDWVALAINSPQGRAYAASVVSQQVGQANVNGTKLKAFPLPVPSIGEQAERVRAHRDIIDARRALMVQLDVAARRAERLRRALLAAAFSGRLTGRSSDLEHAEELASR